MANSPRNWRPVARVVTTLSLAMMAVLAATPVRATETALGPGVAGQVHAAAYDPADPQTVYVGSDVAGVLVTHNHGGSWSPFNAGLGNADLAATSYVDDLLVIRSAAVGVPRRGIYAATHGGIFFNDGSGWQLKTPYSGAGDFRYSGGFAAMQDDHTPITDLYIPIPFSSLAFDESTGILYAGAGMGRQEEKDGQHARDNYYPDGNGTTSPLGLHSLWKCNLADPSGTWESIPNAGNWGIVRQIAIVYKSGQPSKVAVTTRNGVHLGTVTSSGWVDDGNVWTSADKLVNFPMNAQAKQYWNENAWGVGGGFDGKLYVAKMAVLDSAGNTLSDPGVFSLDAFASGAGWVPVGDDTLSVFLKGVDPERDDMTWSEVIHAADLGSHHASTLLGLTVIPGNGTRADELFVGERTLTTNTGCFRYGPDPSREGLNHWLYILYMDKEAGSPGLAFDNFRFHTVNCFSTSEPPTDTEFNPGWASNNPLAWTVPLIVYPSESRHMMAFAYHFPMAFDSPSSGWEQRNCLGSGTVGDPDNGSWTSNGLNMMGVNAIAFAKKSNRLVIADEDFTGFMSTTATQSAFKWLDWYADGAKDGQDIAILEHDGAERVLFVRGAPEKAVPTSGPAWRNIDFGFVQDRQTFVVAEYDPSIPDEPTSAPKNGYNWKYLSRGLDAYYSTPFKVVDIETAGPDLLFAACMDNISGQTRIFRGVYDGVDVAWTPWRDFGAGGPRAVEMRCLPNSSRLLVAASDERAGVYCLDTADSTVVQAWLQQDVEPWWESRDDRALSEYQNRALEHVTTIECDRMGQVVYLGTNGEVYDLDASYYGAVWQLTIPSGRSPVTADWRMIANETSTANSFGFGQVSATGFWRWPGEGPGPRLTCVRDIEIDPGNPYKIYVGLGMSGLRGQGTFNPSNGVWTTEAPPEAISPDWTRVFPESAVTQPTRGAYALAIDPLNPSDLYIGTSGQEMYKASFTPAPHPAIAAQAAHPLLAVTADSTVLAIRITSADSVKTATADLSGLGRLGVVLSLRDDGKRDDVAAGDGIFTSGRFLATLSVGTSDSVLVFAQDANGGYDQRYVGLEVIPGAVKFSDVSPQTGDLYNSLPDTSSSPPYSAVYFNATSATDSKKVMVVTFDDNETAPQMFERTYIANLVPRFERRSGGRAYPSWFDTLYVGSRGLAADDFDRDPGEVVSDTDLFICNPTSGGRLYRSNFAQGSESFTDVTTSMFGAAASELAGAVTAAWGNFDDDGFVDLAVATTTYVNPVKSLGTAVPSGSVIKIFRNVGGTHFELLPYSGIAGGPNICLSLAWVDVDQDGDQDLVAWHYLTMGSAPFLMLNLGHSEIQGQHVMVPSTLDIQGNWAGGMSVCEIDYDHDLDLSGKSYPDLLVTESYGDRRAMVLRNLMGSGSPTLAFETIPLASGRDWSGAVAADFDLNMQQDLLLLPQGGQPGLLMRGDEGSSPTYRDLAFTTGLRPGATSGALTADFNDDGRPDLFLGRIKRDQFMYRNELGDVAGGALTHWLRVGLGTVGNSDFNLTGAAVTVTANGVSQTRVVSGGGGRGGQPSNDMLFGLGATASGTANVTVRYRSGEIDQFTSAIDTTVIAMEDQPIVLKPSTKSDPEPKFSYDLAPGTSTWVFRWRTVGIRGDLAQDVVHVENYSNYGTSDPCYIGIAPGAVMDLKLNDPGVKHTVYRSGNYWQHEVRWGALPCQAGCSYRFWVTSGLGNGSTVSSPPKLATPIVYCIPELEQ